MEAVQTATGRDWDDWFTELDAAGAAELSHKQIVAHLERQHPELTSWWRQSLTVGYERARGKRAVGQVADATFQIGVQRSVALDPTAAWELLTTRADLWLGEGADVTFAAGEPWSAAAARGEIRVVKPGDRLRLTWRPDGWAEPATLQLTLLPSGPAKTAIHASLEKLPDAAAREMARERSRAALERLVAAAA